MRKGKTEGYRDRAQGGDDLSSKGHPDAWQVVLDYMLQLGSPEDILLDLFQHRPETCNRLLVAAAEACNPLVLRGLQDLGKNVALPWEFGTVRFERNPVHHYAQRPVFGHHNPQINAVSITWLDPILPGGRVSVRLGARDPTRPWSPLELVTLHQLGLPNHFEVYGPFEDPNNSPSLRALMDALDNYLGESPYWILSGYKRKDEGGRKEPGPG